MQHSQWESSQRLDTPEEETPSGKGEGPKLSMRGIQNKETAASLRAVAIIATISALCSCANSWSASDIVASIDKTIRFVCGVHSAIPQTLDASAESQNVNDSSR